MMTRRAGLALAAAMPAAALLSTGPAHATPEAPTVRTPPSFTPPPGATDSHVHVFLDTAAYPY